MSLNSTERHRQNPYQDHAREYDAWFDRNPQVYAAELQAVRSLLGPADRPCIEVGVGTGRFAAPLGIGTGIEPALAMARLARQRGLQVIGARAEALPLREAAVRLALMVTVICFVEDMGRTFREAFRVLSPGGRLVLGMLDRGSPAGQRYTARKKDSLFFDRARFRSVDEALAAMAQAGFRDFRFCQTLFQDAPDTPFDTAVAPGHGQGLFAVIQAGKN